MNRTSRRIIGWSALGVALIALWSFVLPPQLGGRTVFLTTRGTSMQPLLADGDLAVIRKQTSYRIGEIVQYHSSALDAPVLHRIVAIEDGKLSTKGDNNNFVDLDHPTTDQITGKMVHRIVDGGRYMDWLKSTPARIIGFGLIGWAIYSALRDGNQGDWQRQGRRRPRLLDLSARTLNHPELSSLLRRLPRLQPALIVATVVCIAITSVLIAKPDKTAGSRQLMYSIHGQFAYSATATDGDLVYRNGQVSTGDPIFTSLVDDLFLTFDYSLSSAGKFHGEGKIALQGVVKGTSGWTHQLALSDVHTFEGSDARVGAVVNVDHVRQLVSDVQRTANIKEPNYFVVLQPTVELDGTLGGEKFHDNFTPSLTFTADGSSWKIPSKKDPANGPQGTNSQGTSAGVEVGKGGSLTIPSRPTAALKTAGVTFGITALRTIAVVLSIVLISLTILARVFGRRQALHHLDGIDGVDTIVAKRNELFIAVQNIALSDKTHIVDVTNLATLTRIAEQFEAPILHKAGNLNVFVLDHGGCTYRYARPVVNIEERFGSTHEKDSVES